MTDRYLVGLRVMDIEHGLREIQPTGVVEGEFANTLLLGKAANLALHLRGLNVLEDVMGLRYAAAELGIRSTELDRVLRELNEIGWVRLKKSGSEFRRIEVLVPELRDGLDTIGERWHGLYPSEIEQASVGVLGEAIQRPLSFDDLTAKMGMERGVAETVVSIGESGSYLGTHRLPDGGKVVYSPLFHDGNPEKAHAVVKKYGDDRVKQLVSIVRERQGTPYLDITDQSLLISAARAGIVLSPSVNGKRFVFLPQKGMAQHETVVLDKARAVLSCVRYGQHYADITKIRYPRWIINTLIERKKLKPHSEHAKQYGLLVKKGLGCVEKMGSRYQFSVLDTEDNMKALRVARNMLETGEGVDQSLDDDAQMRIVNPSGSYATPTVERVRLNKRIAGGKHVDDHAVEIISGLIRGSIHV